MYNQLQVIWMRIVVFNHPAQFNLISKGRRRLITKNPHTIIS